VEKLVGRGSGGVQRGEDQKDKMNLLGGTGRRKGAEVKRGAPEVCGILLGRRRRGKKFEGIKGEKRAGRSIRNRRSDAKEGLEGSLLRVKRGSNQWGGQKKLKTQTEGRVRRGT